MRFGHVCLIVAAFASGSALAQTAPPASPAAAASAATEACGSFRDFMTTACPLSWYGITIFGTYDIGVGWVSHGLPVNPNNYEGEALVNRNGADSRWLVTPNNLSQTGLGIKGKEEFLEIGRAHV